MLRIVNTLANSVRKAPVLVIVAVLLLTGVLGYFVPQAELADGQEGFAPDAPELTASNRIPELFGDGSSGSVMQVIFSSDSGDVVTAEGREAVARVTAAVESSAVADRLQAQPGRGSSISFFAPLDGGAPGGPSINIVVSSDDGDVFTADGQGVTQQVAGAAFSTPIAAKLSEGPETPPLLSFLAPLGEDVFSSTADLKEAYLANFPDLPAEFAGVLPFLSSNDSDLSAPSASKGMVVLNLTELPTDEELSALAEALDGIELPAGYSLSTPVSDPTTEGLKEAYLNALAFVPADQGGFVEQLLSSSADFESATASHGLMLVFLQTPDPEDVTAYVEDISALSDSLAELDLPAGFTAEPFAFELLLADDSSFTDEIARIFQLAGMIIVGILLLVYWLKPKGRLSWIGSIRRTFADMAITIFTILLAITWMQGVGVLLSPTYLDFIGHSSSMAQILPILLIGLGVDYGIHLTSRYREEVGDGGVKPAINTSIRTVGVALVLATITTMVGFLTNLISPIPALVDFGVLAAVGILVSFILMLTFVPAVRQLLDTSAEKAGRLPAEDLRNSDDRILNRVIGKTSLIAEKFAWGAVIAAVILAGLGEVGRQRLETTFSFTDFIAQDSPLLGTLNTLSEEFGGGFGETTSVLIEGDVSSVATHNAGIDALAVLADTPDVLLFAGQVAASPIALIDSLSSPTSPTFNPDVAAAVGQAGLGADLRAPDTADLTALYEAVRTADPAGYSSVIHETGGIQDAALWTMNTQAGDLRVSELREALSGVFVPIADMGMDVIATSQTIISDVVVSSLQESQVGSLVITLLAATAILMVNFWFESRRPLLGVITMAPVGLVVLLTFGMMALTGIPFGPVTATISALAIGIGVPYTIHITHRFLEDRERYETTNEAIRSTTLHTGSALAGSALTTIAGFGVLVTSTLKPFQQFGAVTAYAIGFALMVSILILPSFLAIWDRWHRSRGRGPDMVSQA